MDSSALEAVVDALLVQLHCSLCNNTFNNPHVFHQCGHVFCYECVAATLEGPGIVKSQCPTCGGPAWKKELRRVRLVEDLVEKLRVLKGLQLQPQEEAGEGRPLQLNTQAEQEAEQQDAVHSQGREQQHEQQEVEENDAAPRPEAAALPQLLQAAAARDHADCLPSSLPASPSAAAAAAVAATATASAPDATDPEQLPAAAPQAAGGDAGARHQRTGHVHPIGHEMNRHVVQQQRQRQMKPEASEAAATAAAEAGYGAQETTPRVPVRVASLAALRRQLHGAQLHVAAQRQEPVQSPAQQGATGHELMGHVACINGSTSVAADIQQQPGSPSLLPAGPAISAAVDQLAADGAAAAVDAADAAAAAAPLALVRSRIAAWVQQQLLLEPPEVPLGMPPGMPLDAAALLEARYQAAAAALEAELPLPTTSELPLLLRDLELVRQQLYQVEAEIAARTGGPGAAKAEPAGTEGASIAEGLQPAALQQPQQHHSDPMEIDAAAAAITTAPGAAVAAVAVAAAGGAATGAVAPGHDDDDIRGEAVTDQPCSSISPPPARNRQSGRRRGAAGPLSQARCSKVMRSGSAVSLFSASMQQQHQRHRQQQGGTQAVPASSTGTGATAAAAAASGGAGAAKEADAAAAWEITSAAPAVAPAAAASGGQGAGLLAAARAAALTAAGRAAPSSQLPAAAPAPPASPGGTKPPPGATAAAGNGAAALSGAHHSQAGEVGHPRPHAHGTAADPSAPGHTHTDVQPPATAAAADADARPGTAADPAATAPLSLVHRRVGIYWKDDAEFYPGIITAYNKRTGKHTILYDDGVREHLVMTREVWKFEGEEAGENMGAAAGDAAGGGGGGAPHDLQQQQQQQIHQASQQQQQQQQCPAPSTSAVTSSSSRRPPKQQHRRQQAQQQQQQQQAGTETTSLIGDGPQAATAEPLPPAPALAGKKRRAADDGGTDCDENAPAAAPSPAGPWQSAAAGAAAAGQQEGASAAAPAEAEVSREAKMQRRPLAPVQPPQAAAPAIGTATKPKATQAQPKAPEATTAVASSLPVSIPGALTASKHVVVCHTLLDKALLKQLERFCARVPCAQVVHEFTPSTTHLIVGKVSSGQVAERRTTKQLLAVLSGCWVLSWQWVGDSLSAGSWRDEEPYWVKGDPYGQGAPRLGRQRLLSNGPRLFEGINFHVEKPGKSKQMLEDLLQLLAAGGAKQVSRPPPRRAATGLAQQQQQQAAADGGGAACGDTHPTHQQQQQQQVLPRVLVLWCSEERAGSEEDVRASRQRWGCDPVQHLWVHACISRHTLLPTGPFTYGSPGSV